MEVMMIFPLLLLMCSLSTAELQTAQLSSNEIIPQGEQTESQGRRAANAFDPQHTGPGDIHAVLSEMSTLLAEQKVEIRHLQRENEAQAAQLRDLELQKSGLEKLKQQVQVKVAFSASLLASGSGTIGPFNTHTPLAFRYVLTNIGNAYNPNSGFFIAPVRGVYRFEFYISAYGNPSHATAAILVKNGQHIFSAYERQDSRYVSTANAATLLLESGDVMFLSLWAHCRIYDDESHLSTFSGHLLFTV